MSQHYHMVIIGGGIHGAGIAQAGAAAGYRVLVLEQEALAAATSGASSKLIHGGLRYLETGQYRLVRESLAEREQLLTLAPDLVRLIPFHVPVYRHTRRRPWQVRLGLTLYALLGGLSRDNRFRSIPRRHWAALDGLTTEALEAVYRYYDAQTDDKALTTAVMRSAQALGAELRLPARFISAERFARGFNIVCAAANGQETYTADTLVNAAGAWADEVLARIAPMPPRREIELVQGSHILVGGAMRQGAYYLEAPQDHRPVFVLPWYEQTLIGTTETAFDGDPAQVHAQPQEVDYLQTVLRHYFPAHPTEVLNSFAGLRVLPRGKGPYGARPRAPNIVADGGAPPRLVTLYGGKLTSYHATAAKVLSLLHAALPAATVRADTTKLTLRP